MFKQKDIARKLLNLGIKDNVLFPKEIEERMKNLRNEIPRYCLMVILV